MANNEKEIDAAKLLLREGVPVKIGRRTYRVKELCLGMLDAITAIRLKMKIDEQAVKENPIGGANIIIKDNIFLAAKVVAIAILGWGRVKRKLFTAPLAWYLYERLKPSTLLESAGAIIQMSNAADFMNTIRLMHGIQMTAPKMDPSLIEKTLKVPGATVAPS